MELHKKHVLSILFSLVLGISLASPRTDSLKSLLSTAPNDSVYIAVLNQLAEAYQNTNPVMALDYAVKAEKLATANNQWTGLFLANLNIGLYYENKSNNELAMDYYHKSLRIAENLNAQRYMAQVLNLLGNIYRKKGMSTRALDHLNRSLNLQHFLKDSLGIAHVNNHIGLIYFEQNKYDKALLHYYNSLRLEEALNDQRGMAQSYKNIGILYQKTNNYEQAKINLTRSLDFFQEFGNQSGIAEVLLYLGDIYEMEKKYILAIDALSSSLNTYLEIGHIKGTAEAYLRLGHIYSYLGKDYLAYKNYKQSLQYYRMLDDPHGQVKAQLALAAYYYKEGAPQQAKALLQKSLNTAQELHFEEEEHQMINLLAEIHLNMQDFQKAAIYFKQAKDLGDKLYSSKLIKEVAQIEMQHEFEKLAQEHEFQQRQLKTEQENKLQYIRKIRNILAGSLILVVFLVLLILTKQRTIVNKNRILQKHNERYNRNNKILDQQKKELLLAGQTKDRFLSIIAHDLRHPFYAITNFTSLMEQMHDQVDEDTYLQYLRLIQEANENVNNLLDNMLEWGLSQDSTFKPHPQSISLNNLLHGNIVLIKEQLRQNNIHLVQQLDDNPLVVADKNMINTVVRNLLSNAVKFSNPKGTVFVRTLKMNGKVRIEIEDEGIGISPADLDKIFEAGTPKRGKNGESSSGLGLILCVDFLKAHKQLLKVESRENEGTKFWFELELVQNMDQN